jgi:hypothetical protein
MSVEGRGSMSIKGNLSKVAELGIGIAAVATLVLGGCGGASSGGSSNSATVSGAAANQFLADTTVTWNADSVSTPTAGTPSVIAFAVTDSFVATSANNYTRGRSAIKLATATSSLWSPAKSLSNSYYLSATGWQLYDGTTASYTVNGNGAISYTRMDGQLRGDISAITRTDLSGQLVACTNPMGNYPVGQQIATAYGPAIVTAASCPIAATYPAGSASYTSTINGIGAERYILIDNSFSYTLTDGAGVTLSELPSIGAQFCLDTGVYDPIPGAVAGADNYRVYPFSNYELTGPCTATDIATALNNGSTETARVSLKATGNAVVPNVFVITAATGAITSNIIYTFHLGKLISGSNSPAGTRTSTSTSFNKTAANAQLRANGLPPLP